MRLDRMSYGALALGALVAVGLTACGTHTTRADSTTSKQLAAAGEAPQRGPIQTSSDAIINGKVKAVLAADGLVKARNINVDTIRGVVQLNGTVGSTAEKAQALKLAREVSGVVEVKDNLKVVG
jgi:hyperosmotically inducible periplasmic protein